MKGLHVLAGAIVAATLAASFPAHGATPRAGARAAKAPPAVAADRHAESAPPPGAPSTPGRPPPAPTARAFAVASAPGWIDALEPAPIPAALPAGGIQIALSDKQVGLDGAPGADARVHHDQRVVRQVNDAASLARAAQVEIEFDPAYEALTLHALDVVRDGRRLPRLDPARVQVLQRETQLEQQHVDGRLSATVVLDDVRVGDRIDIAYSLVGANPVRAAAEGDDAQARRHWQQAVDTGVVEFIEHALARRRLRSTEGR